MRLEKRDENTWRVYSENGCLIAVVSTENRGREVMREFARDMGMQS